MRVNIFVFCWLFSWSGISFGQAYIALDNGRVAEMEFALELAKEVCASDASIAIEILAGGEGVRMFAQNDSPVVDLSREVQTACSQVKFYVCEETVVKMRAAGAEHVPNFFEDVEEVICEQRIAELVAMQWWRIDTSVAN